MTVHASDAYKLGIQPGAPPDYPPAPQPDTFSTTPFAATYAERRAAFLAHWRQNPAPASFKAPFYELVRLAAGGPVHEGVFTAALDFIDARKDCSDFILHAFIRLLYQFKQNPAFTPVLLERIKRTVLGFKYWPDEPGIDSMCTWTENHQILFNAAGYLLGQMYPDEVFANSEQTGLEKMAITRSRILRWLDLRFRTGFSEWVSHVYYDEDLVPLINLADFCEDPEIATRARMVIDLILFDMACNSFRGVFGSTHGRSYENTKKYALQEGTADTGKLLFGRGIFSGFDNMSAACFALSTTYRMPRVLYEIANDDRPTILHRQRMGIRLAEADRWGLRFDNPEDGMIVLSLEAYTHPRTINLIMRMFDAFNWWENGFFSMFKARRGLINTLRRAGLLPMLARLVEKDITRNLREEVNIVTYRTPDYMLSSAVDYRPGYGGDQHHIWQATLGPDAVVFTTHPAQREGSSPNYWTGSGSLPRAAQIENVGVIVYNINTAPGLYITHKLLFTHAWFPRAEFDEVIEQDGWLFARKGDGYLALTSRNPYRRAEDDPQNEIIADGKQNIWVCEMGRRETDGPFGDFVERVCSAPLIYQGLAVIYDSPSQGRIEFGWKGSLRHRGELVRQSEFLRYDNPYAQVPFPARQVIIQQGDHTVSLDWDSVRREASELL